jgi:hypothetical protein
VRGAIQECQQRGKTIQVASMMVLHHYAGVPVGPKNHHLGLDLDMHEDRLSLLQSNVAQGRFGNSQTVDYLARRNQTFCVFESGLHSTAFRRPVFRYVLQNEGIARRI